MFEANEAKVTNKSDLHAGYPKYGRYATRPIHQHEVLTLKRSVVQGDHQTLQTPLDKFKPILGSFFMQRIGRCTACIHDFGSFS